MDVYDEIRTERVAQIDKGRDADVDDARSWSEWIQCLGGVVAKYGWARQRTMWIKVATIAVSAVEAIDRKGPACDHGAP